MTNDLTRETTDALLSSLIDQHVATTHTLGVHEAAVSSLKQELTRLEDQIAAEMTNQKLTAAGGQIGRAEFKPKRAYKVDPAEWNLLYTHIAATGEFDLLHKRISTTALDERVRAGVNLPPGVRVASFNVLEVKGRKS